MSAPTVAADGTDDSWADSARGGGPPALAKTSTAPARRELKLRPSRERTPPPRSRTRFAIGDFVEVFVLAKRTELNGACGSIIETGGRIAIKLVSSKSVRVKPENIKFKQQDGRQRSVSLSWNSAPAAT